MGTNSVPSGCIVELRYDSIKGVDKIRSYLVQIHPPVSVNSHRSRGTTAFLRLGRSFFHQVREIHY